MTINIISPHFFNKISFLILRLIFFFVWYTVFIQFRDLLLALFLYLFFPYRSTRIIICLKLNHNLYSLTKIQILIVHNDIFFLFFYQLFLFTYRHACHKLTWVINESLKRTKLFEFGLKSINLIKCLFKRRENKSNFSIIWNLIFY